MRVVARSARPALRSLIVMAVLLTLTPAAGWAQVFGTWAPAVPYAPDSYHAGAFLLVGEPLGLMGQFRTGIDQNWDIGIQLGFPDFDRGDETVFGLGGDVKYLILPDEEGEGGFPMDLALDFAFGWQHVQDFNLVDFDFGGVVSKSVTTDGGTTLIPYGALMLAIGRASFDVPPGFVGDSSDTELDINVRLGLDYPASSDLELLGELNLSSRDETLALALGLMARL